MPASDLGHWSSWRQTFTTERKKTLRPSIECRFGRLELEVVPFLDTCAGRRWSAEALSNDNEEVKLPGQYAAHGDINYAVDKQSI